MPSCQESIPAVSRRMKLDKFIVFMYNNKKKDNITGATRRRCLYASGLSYLERVDYGSLRGPPYKAVKRSPAVYKNSQSSSTRFAEVDFLNLLCLFFFCNAGDKILFFSLRQARRTNAKNMTGDPQKHLLAVWPYVPKAVWESLSPRAQNTSAWF